MSDNGDDVAQSPVSEREEFGADLDAEQPLSDAEGDLSPEAGRVADGRTDALRRCRERNTDKDLLRGPFPDVDMAPNAILRFPAEYVKPLRMCGVSKKLVCLSDDTPRLEPMGCELVFVSMGELMSKHVQMVCHLFDMLNKRHDIDGCAVAVPNRTRLATQQRSGSKKKEPVVVGIQELFGPREETFHDFVHYEDWPEAASPMKSFAEFSRGVYMDDEETHVSTSHVRLRLGVIPIEYVVNGEKIRTVCIVIRVVPAEGLDLLKLIEDKYLANRHANDRAGGEEIRNWCDVWQRVLDYETGVNLKFQGHRILPDVMDVRSATSAGSALDILAPFLVFEKILNNLPGGYCGLEKRSEQAIEPGSLLISGYPRVVTGNRWQEWCVHMRRVKEAYRKQLTQWRFVFLSMLAGDQTQTLPRVVFDDGVRVSLEMEVSMRFSSEVVTTFDKMEPVTMPKLAIACIGAFMSLVAVEEEETVRPSSFRSADPQVGVVGRANVRVQGSFEEYVRPYVEHDLQVATQCLLTDRYERSLGGADMPYAGRHILVQQSLRTTMRIVKDDPSVCADTFLKYISTRITVSEREELMGVYHSERMMAIAKILESLIKRDLCACVENALHFVSERMSMERRRVEQRILPFEEFMAFYDLQSAIQVYNESAKLNALNLTAFFALMVSDVLTFLGTHNATWIFKQFTVWTICGNGHLRAKGMTCTMKRNSSGHGLVSQAFVLILMLMANIPGSTFADLASALKNYKLARITAPQVEMLAAVVVVAGKVLSKPDPDNFFKPITMDEFLRNVDLLALNTLITRIPRDSDGSNITIKTCDPANHSMVRQSVVNSDIEGCGPFLCFVATNSNPDNIKISEPLKTFLVIAAAVCPGAPHVEQDHDMMSTLSKGKRKKMNEGGGNKHEGLSTGPKDRDTETHLAYALSVVPAVARRLALLNKAGVVDFELSESSIILFNWFLYFASNHLDFIFGATQFSDLHRIMQGYMSRGVALSLLVTTMQYLRRHKTTYRRACRDILIKMVSSGMSVALTHTAILSGLGRMVCPNIVWLNRVVARMTLGGEGTPVLNFEWFCDFLDARKPVNPADANFIRLKRFISNIEMKGEYVCVPNIADRCTYKRLETYMEKYLSIMKESYDVYLNMLIESAPKRMQLESLLNVSDVSLKTLCRRLGVAHGDGVNPDPDQNTENTFLYIRNGKDARDPIKDVFVHVVCHLWLLALQGPHPLHSENSYQVASRLYAWVMRRFMPAQVVHAGMIFMDSFEGANAAPRICRTDLSYIDTERGESVIDYGHKGRGPSYIMRPIDDSEVWDTERISASPSFLEPYLPEDMMHMGGSVQLHKSVMQEIPTAPFAPLPGVSARLPELMPTRVYPIRDDSYPEPACGVICICPNGFNFVLLSFSNEKMAVSLERWSTLFDDNCLGASPLVHRPNAVVVLPEEGGLGLIRPREDNPFESLTFETLVGWKDTFHSGRVPVDRQYFMDCKGEYSVVDKEGCHHAVHNQEEGLPSLVSLLFLVCELA